MSVLTSPPNRASQVRSIPVTSPDEVTDEVTIARAAEMFDFLPEFIESLVESQQIPSRFDGLNVVVRPDEIEAFLAVERELRLQVVAEMVAEDQKMGLYQ